MFSYTNILYFLKWKPSLIWLPSSINNHHKRKFFLLMLLMFLLFFINFYYLASDSDICQKISKKWFVSLWVQNAFSRRRLELKSHPYMLKIKFAADALIRKGAFIKYVRSKIRSNPYPPITSPLVRPCLFYM